MKIENYGISSSRRAMSKNDEKAVQILESTTNFSDGHYEIGLLWKENAKLPNNRWLAEKQLKQLNKKLSTKPDLQSKYEETLQKDLQNGYVVKVDPATDKETACSYLPHHPVSNENKPGKIRRVINASSVFQGQSLNSNFLKGPDLLSNLVGVILRFREQQVAVSADIEQIKVAPSDRAFLWFLWNHNGKIEEYEYTRHMFGATSSPCIASYALRRSARDNQDKFPQVLHIIERNVYMDDLYISTADVESAVNVMNSTKDFLSLGGFNLTKWNSNSYEFLKNVANENFLKPDLSSPQPQKVLGLPRNASTDEYIINKRLFKRFPNDQFTTQRKLLKFVASIFDPLGVIAPLTIRVRKILQAIWYKGPQWDAPLDVQQFPDFLQFKNELPTYQNISIPRALFRRNTKIQSTALHTFTDASEYALSAVFYLRTEYVDKTVYIVFMMGKARVAAIKRMTIPNLELQAAVYGAQLAQFIQEQQDLEIGNYFFWSDSTTVFHWLRTPEMLHRIFAANRLAKILDVSSSLNWRYIASSDNPADDRSRGYEARQMNAISRWLSGPSFLRSEEKEWPCQDLLKHNPLVFSIQPLEAPEPSTEGCLIDITRFSNWNRLIRVTAYCFFFRDLCKKQTKILLSLIILLRTGI